MILLVGMIRYRTEVGVTMAGGISMGTLEKYLSKEVVVTRPTGLAEAPTAKELVTYPEKTSLSDAKKDPRQISKIRCGYEGECSDREEGLCYFKGKFCSKQVRERV
jgi:hypothetical protein